MPPERNEAQRLYGKLLSLYPRAFRKRLGGSMQQTFDDLYAEWEYQPGRRGPGFILWMFLDTAVGILAEHLSLVSPGDIMKTILKTTGASALLGLLLITPFMTMEMVNRQSYNEEFPFALFFALWFNLFAIALILLPVMRGRRRANQAEADPVPPRMYSLLTNPRPALVISLVLFLCPLTLRLLDSLGWGEPLNRLFNGPNPGHVYIPGLAIALLVFSLPVVAGIIAGRPIISTLRAGGSLFAHPLHLVLVAVILLSYAVSVGSLIIDQWPCFMGVRMCD